MNFASYRVIAIHDDAVEIWDGISMTEPKRAKKATMICPVGNPHAFEVGDVVDLVVVLRERKVEVEE